jgi:hypothetical protein
MIKSHHTGLSHAILTKVMLTLLLCMEYHVRTAYGVSPEASFSNLILDWLLGIMQGLATRHHAGRRTFLRTLGTHEQCHVRSNGNTPGAEFHSAHPHRICQCTSEAFIDDMTLWLLKMGMLLMAAIALMQTSAQQWERGSNMQNWKRAQPGQMFLVMV